MTTINPNQKPICDHTTVKKMAAHIGFKIARDVLERVGEIQPKIDRLLAERTAIGHYNLADVRAAEKLALEHAIETGGPLPIARSEREIMESAEATKALFFNHGIKLADQLLPVAKRTVLEFCDSLETVASKLEKQERAAAGPFDPDFRPSQTLATMLHLVKTLPSRLPEKCVGPAKTSELFLGLL